MDRKSRSLWKLGWFLFASGKVEKSPGTGNEEIQTKQDLQQNLSYFFLFKIISSFLGICTTFLLDCAFASSFVMLAIPRKSKSLPMEFEDQRHRKRFSSRKASVFLAGASSGILPNSPSTETTCGAWHCGHSSFFVMGCDTWTLTTMTTMTTFVCSSGLGGDAIRV